MSKKDLKPTVAQVDQAKDKIDVQAAVLVGNVRDQMLAIFKNHTDWKKIAEAKQRDIAASCEHLAKDVVRKSANIIAGRGFKSIHGTIESINVKDGLKIVIKASNQVEGRNELIDSQGGSVTMVLSDISPYMANRSEPEIDLDEPKLALTVEKKTSKKKK